MIETYAKRRIVFHVKTIWYTIPAPHRCALVAHRATLDVIGSTWTWKLSSINLSWTFPIVAVVTKMLRVHKARTSLTPSSLRLLKEIHTTRACLWFLVEVVFSRSSLYIITNVKRITSYTTCAPSSTVVPWCHVSLRSKRLNRHSRVKFKTNFTSCMLNIARRWRFYYHLASRATTDVIDAPVFTVVIGHIHTYACRFLLKLYTSIMSSKLPAFS